MKIGLQSSIPLAALEILQEYISREYIYRFPCSFFLSICVYKQSLFERSSSDRQFSPCITCNLLSIAARKQVVAGCKVAK